MKYLLLFIPFNLFGQVWTDTIYFHGYNLEKIGTWKTMNTPNQKGTFPTSANNQISYTFWGKGIEIYTEEFTNHKYYIVDLDNKIDTVFIKGSNNSYNSLTYSRHNLAYANHTLKIRGPVYGYVFNYMIKYVDSSPYPPIDCLPDTVYIYDTIRITRIDTVYLKPNIYIKADSLTFKLE